MGVKKKKGRLPVTTGEVLRLVWHDDDDVIVPDEHGKGWVQAKLCDVSDGAWVLSIRLLNIQQIASVIDAGGEMERKLAALRIGFVDFETVGEPPHKMKRKARLAHFMDACVDNMNLAFFAGWYISLRSEGIDPKPVMTAPFRDDDEPPKRDGDDST